jgi:hypothetical protein
MITFLKTIGLKNIILGAFIIAAISNYIYTQNKIKTLNSELSIKTNDLILAQENNKLIIEAYEQTLKVEREVAKEQSVTTEQKEKVVIKYQTLVKEVEKRGEIKQDENSNFTIVSF